MTAATALTATTDTPDLTSYRNIHRALRRAPHRMAASVRLVAPEDRRRIAGLGRYWKGYAGEVLAHHTIEDDVFFPALVARVDGAAGLIARTDDEHHRLDALMTSVDEGFTRLVRGSDLRSISLVDDLDALAALMDAHLDLEDAEILPLFVRHFSAEEYDVMEDQAVKAIGLGAQAAFTIPFAVAATPEADRAELLAAAPAVLRLLHRATRARHARLEARAFGDVSPSTKGTI